MATIKPGSSTAKASSDASAVVVRSDAALTTSYVASSEVDGLGVEWVDFVVTVTTHASLSKITVQAEAGVRHGSTLVWVPLPWETITDGVATIKSYSMELADPAPVPGSGATVQYLVSAECRLRWVRLKIKADAAAGSASIIASRRV